MNQKLFTASGIKARRLKRNTPNFAISAHMKSSLLNLITVRVTFLSYRPLFRLSAWKLADLHLTLRLPMAGLVILVWSSAKHSS